MIRPSNQSSGRPRYTTSFWAGLRIEPAKEFTFQGKAYRFRGKDDRAKAFLQGLVDCPAASRGSLFAYRDDFRAIIGARPVRCLVSCALFRDGPVRRLAVWLLGLIRNRATIGVLANLKHDPDCSLRKEVAKAFRRMGAWQQLRDMADDPDGRVQRIAIQRPAQPYRDRLRRFLRDHVTAQPTDNRTHELLIGSDRFEGRPPKSAALMRRVLQRIRELVHEQSGKSLFRWIHRPRD